MDFGKIGRANFFSTLTQNLYALTGPNWPIPGGTGTRRLVPEPLNDSKKRCNHLKYNKEKIRIKKKTCLEYSNF